MDPTAATGELLETSALDLTAFDVIGWNVVPEPSTGALLGLGLAGMAARRRSAQRLAPRGAVPA